jgi:hypothetical protein
VFLGVVLGGLISVMRCMSVMALGYLGMVRRLFMIAGFVMLGSFPMVIGRVLMMIGGFGVVMCSFLRHGDFLSREGFRYRAGIFSAFSPAQVAGRFRRRELMVNCAHATEASRHEQAKKKRG